MANNQVDQERQMLDEMKAEIRDIYDEARPTGVKPPGSMLFNAVVAHTVSMIHQLKIPFDHGAFYLEVTRVNNMYSIGVNKTILMHK